MLDAAQRELDAADVSDVPQVLLADGDVFAGVLPGPDSDEDARRFAHACLVPAELLARVELDVERAARALQLAVWGWS
jgi:hypothetical protein